MKQKHYCDYEQAVKVHSTLIAQNIMVGIGQDSNSWYIWTI